MKLLNWTLAVFIIGAMALGVGLHHKPVIHGTCCSANDRLKAEIADYYKKHPNERLTH